jgi:flagella basal body P-ring formation protein FlgA
MQRIFVFIIGLLLFPLLLEAQTKPEQKRDAEIRSAVETYVRLKTAGLGYEIRLKRFSISSGATVLPEGSLEYEIVAPQQWEGWGSTSLAVIVRQGERVLHNIAGRVEVEALAEMAIAVRQIDYGSIVTDSDVALKKLDVAGTQGHYLRNIADVVGKKTRSTIRANSPFRPDQLEKVALIKSGQIVTIVAENARMRVTLTGKARNSGGEGDVINVQNMNSLKEFPAKIIDATTVIVAF